ncbi:Extracellular ligand-binding receptor [uncultured Alphaproteobacteria bacterium]|uniref:Extracellular ligand-binding receptor n=1 Tax=uncultured Alphaproteobacteria bacterium TaxID=91750 RepID=A0A212KB92_9PROT|nr:Extracellular ligand-binding receptor [uncultured Alphaproteobacteria bacterium]
MNDCETRADRRPDGYNTARPARRKLFRRAGVLAAALALGLAACAQPRPTVTSKPTAPPSQIAPAAQQEPQVSALPPAGLAPPMQTPPAVREARVAVLVPLSGEAASAGQALRDAALLAQFEVDNPGLILQFYDTAGTAEGARAAAEQAKDHGATLFVGPLFSHSVQAVTAVAQSAGIPVLSFSTDPSAISANVFVTGFLLGPQVERVIGFAAEQGLQRVAVLAPDTPYGRAAADAAQGAAAKSGATLTRTAFFDPARANFSPTIREFADYTRRKATLEREKAGLAGASDPAAAARLKELAGQDASSDVDFDALLIPASGTALRQVISLLKYYDVDPGKVKILGTLLWQDENLTGEPALVGAWFPAASRVGYDRFTARFTETYGHPPSQLAALAYDAVALAAALGQTGDGSWGRLTANSGFVGVNGAFRLNPNGQIERMLAVREVTATGSREVSPAPTRFVQSY